MGYRTLAMVIVFLLFTIFAAVNWPAFTAPTTLSFVVGNVQAAHRLTQGGLDLAGAFSYQANTTNDLEYRYGNDTIVSTSLGGPVGSRLRATMQLKMVHRGRSTFRGEDVDSTGGTVVYAIPGLVSSLPGKMSVYLFLPVPVYRYVNESQLAPRLSVVVGMARVF